MICVIAFEILYSSYELVSLMVSPPNIIISAKMAGNVAKITPFLFVFSSSF